MSIRQSLLPILFLILFNSAQSQVFVAVIEFEGKGVSSIEASALTDRLILELFQTKHFRVMEREMLDQILTEQELQMSGCTSTECLVEIGQLAGVEQVISGSVSKVGNVFSISARLISVESGEILDVAYFDYMGEMGELLTSGMGNVASQLVSKEDLVETAPDQVLQAATKGTSDPIVLDDPSSKTIVLDGRFLSISPRIGMTAGDLVPLAYGASVGYQLGDRSVVGIDVGYAYRLDTENMERNEFESMNIYATYEYLLNHLVGVEIAAGYHDGVYDSFVNATNHDIFDYSGPGIRLGVNSHFPAAKSRFGISPRASIELALGDATYFAFNLSMSADIRLSL